MRTGARKPASSLTLDLRFDAEGTPDEDGPVTSLGDLSALARRPSALIAALRAEPEGELRVLIDDLPLSGVQAAAMLLAATFRRGRFVAESPRGSRRHGRLAFFARAAAATATALPGELARSRRLYQRASEAAERELALPRQVADPASVVYLRSEPSVRWRGHLVGGAATHTTGVINGFAANGLDLDVLASERPEWTDGVRFTAVAPRRVYHLVPWLTLADYGEEVARAAADRRPDFVYQRYSVGAWPGLELAHELGVPLVLEYNGSELWIQRHWGAEEEARFSAPLRALEERNVRSASLVVVVSSVLKEQLVEAGVEPDRVLVNPNGVDVDRLRPYRERPPEAWREEHGLPQAPTIGFVGSFGLWHGVKVLPAMVAHLAERAPTARWMLIGDGPLHEEVRAEIAQRGLEDRVEMPGIVAHDRALALLASCDVCVSPHVPNADGSRFFGSPTKLFEYMGLARPIVVSDLEQLGEVIVDGESGVLTAPGDARAAADAVADLLDDPDLRRRLGEGALQRATQTYSWRAHTRRILDALQAGRVEAAPRGREASH
jgi:glycosyltransferase involved in cell wall biosynthesis